MRIAIVGSRKYGNLEQVRDFVMNLDKEDTVISGGAEGVDLMATTTAEARGIWVKTFKPDWKRYGNKAGAIRNKQIVDDADRVVAFWDRKSKGTKITVDMAVTAKKPVKIYTEDGAVMTIPHGKNG